MSQRHLSGPYFDRQGQPITAQRWLDLEIDPAYTAVLADVVGKSTVTTTWDGRDFACTPGRVPWIFRTVVTGGRCDKMIVRYARELEARAGHLKVLATVRAEAAAWQRLISDPSLLAALAVVARARDAHVGAFKLYDSDEHDPGVLDALVDVVR